MFWRGYTVKEHKNNV